MNNNVLILERSSENLKKISDKDKYTLEGVFCQFGVTNRNDRVYQENEYLKHLSYLQNDIKNNNLLGELDHPERFEVALGNVSHRVTELWYDQSNRQVKGRIELLPTPKGQIAKSLIDAGIPLSISSRAAGSVNDDKTVEIQQIYTYDLVAKPGFENATLHGVNESQQARINGLIKQLNESISVRNEKNISTKLGIDSDSISIIDLTDKYPSIKLREEAKSIFDKTHNTMENKNNENTMEKTNFVSEDAMQKWSIFVKKEISKLNERLDTIEGKILESGNDQTKKELTVVKNYVEKIRKIQEDSLNWQSDIAKGLNKVARFSDKVASKCNEHYEITQKITEAVDHNAKMLNATSDWTGKIAKTTNAIAETVDHNAKMLNGINEWNTQLAKAVNALNEWSVEKAKAINHLHEWGAEKAVAINGLNEWLETIAKNLNRSINWTESNFGKVLSKDDAKTIVEFMGSGDETLKTKIYEMLSKHSITLEQLNEGSLKGLDVLDAESIGKQSKQTTSDIKSKDNGVTIDPKSHAIIAKIKNVTVGKSKLPAGISTIEDSKDAALKLTTSKKVKGVDTLETTKSMKTKPNNDCCTSGKTDQKLKLDTKPCGKLKEELNRTETISSRKTNLESKLAKIVEGLEKEKAQDQEIANNYPFTSVLSESDRKRFSSLSLTDKTKVNEAVSKVPTVESAVILKLWENALAGKSNDEPLWLKAAPNKYRDAYNKATPELKESVNARSEFYTLNTQYQINNFWETSGIINSKPITLNEAVIAASKSTEAGAEKMDLFVNSIGEAMKKYN